jgi:preprotein translocase subunit SecA
MLSQTFHLLKTAGRPSAARLSRWQAQARAVVRKASEMQALTDERLQETSRALMWRARSGEPLANLLVEAYALVREAGTRALGKSHYPVQIAGGIALFEGGIAEMQTGEGKTLTATLPTYLYALLGTGAHVITVNDYLASRDAEEMGKVYALLGLSTGCITSEADDKGRKEAYAKDITYGTAKEFGFDFLRDRLKRGTDGWGGKTATGDPATGEDFGGVQRGHFFALVDEADSILVDEARTPLIIALNQPNDPATVSLYRWADRATHHLQNAVDYVYEADKRAAYLTDAGCRKAMLLKKPALLDTVNVNRIYEQLERALIARFGFQKDRDYVVHDNEVIIVDESTGRMMDGRKWQDGLHQAIEAKELVPITAATGQAARITVQSFFRHYRHLAGMTGTAVQVARELKRTFRLKTTVIPTHRPCIRKGLPTRIFATLESKNAAIVEEIARLRAAGRAILVGTPSVERSELLARALKALGVPHTVLNARFHKEEAEIISTAGRAGAVTIATNMAGRGTDILLDDDVRKSGGLHVIATEMHSSYRIDRQLVGRSARQGDPGTYQFFLSLEDELLRCLEFRRLARIRAGARPDRNGELGAGWLRFFRKTQRFLERQHAKQRKQLLKGEKQRTDQYEKMGLDPFLEMTD